MRIVTSTLLIAALGLPGSLHGQGAGAAGSLNELASELVDFETAVADLSFVLGDTAVSGWVSQFYRMESLSEQEDTVLDETALRDWLAAQRDTTCSVASTRLEIETTGPGASAICGAAFDLWAEALFLGADSTQSSAEPLTARVPSLRTYAHNRTHYRDVHTRVVQAVERFNVLVRGCGCITPPKKKKTVMWAFGVHQGRVGHVSGTASSGILSTNLLGDAVAKVLDKVAGGTGLADNLKRDVSVDILLPSDADLRGRVITGIGVGLFTIPVKWSTTTLVRLPPPLSWVQRPVQRGHTVNFKVSAFVRSIPQAEIREETLMAAEGEEAKAFTAPGLRLEVFTPNFPRVALAAEWTSRYVTPRNPGDVVAKTVLGDPAFFANSKQTMFSVALAVLTSLTR